MSIETVVIIVLGGIIMFLSIWSIVMGVRTRRTFDWYLRRIDVLEADLMKEQDELVGLMHPEFGSHWSDLCDERVKTANALVSRAASTTIPIVEMLAHSGDPCYYCNGSSADGGIDVGVCTGRVDMIYEERYGKEYPLHD